MLWFSDYSSLYSKIFSIRVFHQWFCKWNMVFFNIVCWKTYNARGVFKFFQLSLKRKMFGWNRLGISRQNIFRWHSCISIVFYLLSPFNTDFSPWCLCIQCLAMFGRNWLWKSKVSKRIHTRGPRALTVTWVSETLHWLLVRRAHISIKQWHRKAALYFLNTIVITI